MSETDNRISYPIILYIKLGKDKVTAYNGRQVTQIYREFIKKQEAAWLGVNSLILGIAQERKTEFVSAIEQGQSIDIFFAVGRTYDDGCYMIGKANLIGLQTSQTPINSPEVELTPVPWQQAKTRSWLKVNDWRSWDESGLNLADYMIISSGRLLSEVIKRSYVHYGYLVRK